MLTASPTSASTGRPPPEPNLGALDIDGFIHRNQPTWQRLADRTRRARGASGGSARASSTSWSPTTSARPPTSPTPGPPIADPGLTARLTRLVAEANGVIYGKRTRTLSSVGRFFAVTFPAAVWHARRFVLVSALLLLVPAVAVGGLDRDLGRGPRRRRPRGGAGGLPRGGLRGVLLVGARGAVRHRGHRQQHPGVHPGLRRRDRPSASGAAYVLVLQRGQPGGGGRAVRGRRRVPQVLRPDPAPRPAGAHRHLAGRRPPGSRWAGRSSPPATAPGATPSPRRAGARWSSSSAWSSPSSWPAPSRAS